MNNRTYRRVVSGLGEDGESRIMIDGEVPAASSMSGRSAVVWRTDSVPADNSGTADVDPGNVNVQGLSGPGSLFMIHTFPPDHGLGEPFWHATDSIDYITMISGEVVFVTETGETAVRAGDVLVDRGIVHAWRNDSEADAVAAIVVVPALPVGKGRTH
jgi:quercetin dioxygenase-like cupin family protein